MRRLLPVVSAITLSLPASVLAQDTRTVTEPIIPATCFRLTAQLAGPLAEADEARLDTERIQKAIDSCKAERAVELAPDGTHNAFLTGPLELRKGVTLVVDQGVTLYGSRDPRVYELQPGSCGLVSDAPRGCKPLISGKEVPGAAIMGEGIIDGRGGSKILGQSKTWWNLAEDARAGGRQQVPRLIEIDKSDNFTIYRITLKNSPNFHVVYSQGDGFTVWGLKIDTPENARNTDGVDPGASKNITVTQSYIRDGDDNIAIKGGNGPVTNMSVIHNHFYYGHGMSIGSETNAGVSKIRVTDLSLDGTTAGIRIKSNGTRGGLVDDVIYKDICIRNSKTPIDLDTAYSFVGKEKAAYPTFKDILLQDVRISGGKQILLNGWDHDHRIGIQFDGVLITDNPEGYKYVAKHADIIYGPGPVNFRLSGEDSREGGKPGSGNLPPCTDKFVPFPVTK